MIHLPSRIAAAVLAACAASAPSGAAEPTLITPVPRAVTVVKASRSCFPMTLQLTGNVVPRSEIAVRPEREGMQTSEILVEPGQTVTSGQVLARLHPIGAPAGAPATDVAAPAAGLVLTAINVIGAPATLSGDPLFRIARAGELELVADVPVGSMERLAPDQSAKVEIIGVGEVRGTTRLVSASVNPITQLGQVTILLGPEPKVRSGVFGRALVLVDQRCRPALPLSAVLYGPGGAIVQVVRNDVVETRKIRVGEIRGATVEVRQGLADGELVLARAGSFVRDGDPVRAIPAPGTP